MKLEIELELSEIYDCNEREIAREIRSDIQKELSKQALEMFKERLDRIVFGMVKKYYEQSILDAINMEIDKIINDPLGGIKWGSKTLTPQEVVEDILKDNRSWNNAQDKLQSFAKSHLESIQKMAEHQFEDLKTKYDTSFAMHLVGRMRENGFLKEEVAALLLSDKEN